jgi:hypothetical protein
MQLETTVMLYNQAATDLEAIRSWWLALPPSDQVRPATINRLVDRSEDIMKAEHAGWVQQMQDAMTKFRLEGDDDEAGGAGRRPPDRQPANGPPPSRGRQQDPPGDPPTEREAPEPREGHASSD